MHPLQLQLARLTVSVVHSARRRLIGNNTSSGDDCVVWSTVTSRHGSTNPLFLMAVVSAAHYFLFGIVFFRTTHLRLSLCIGRRNWNNRYCDLQCGRCIPVASTPKRMAIGRSNVNAAFHVTSPGSTVLRHSNLPRRRIGSAPPNRSTLIAAHQNSSIVCWLWWYLSDDAQLTDEGRDGRV